MFKGEVLRRPHLVLADAGGHDGLAAGDLAQQAQHLLCLNEVGVAVVIERVIDFQLVDVCQPATEVLLEGLPAPEQLRQAALDV